MPQTPWAGLRKPGARVLSLDPVPILATMDGSWMNLLKTLVKWSCGVCTLLRAPTPDIYNLLYQGREENLRTKLHVEGTTMAPDTTDLRTGASGCISNHLL